MIVPFVAMRVVLVKAAKMANAHVPNQLELTLIVHSAVMIVPHRKKCVALVPALLLAPVPTAIVAEVIVTQSSGFVILVSVLVLMELSDLIRIVPFAGTNAYQLLELRAKVVCVHVLMGTSSEMTVTVHTVVTPVVWAKHVALGHVHLWTVVQTAVLVVMIATQFLHPALMECAVAPSGHLGPIRIVHFATTPVRVGKAVKMGSVLAQIH